MTEQFGAIPVRAFGDTRLSAADFRVMGAIAYFDRLGRNGAGCYADPRKLAELANIHYTHVNRHTRRLQDFGYLEIGRSATDRRKRVYSLIYNENPDVIANSGYNLGEVEAKGGAAPPLAEKVANGGYKQPEKVAKPNSQAVDPQTKSPPKRLSEAYSRDPAKPRARDGKSGLQDVTPNPTNHARQGNRGGGNSRAQGHFKLPIASGYQKPTAKRREIDWPGWVARIAVTDGKTPEDARNWIMARLDTIKDERGISYEEAMPFLDSELKKRRKAGA